jgi:hypothetical protein
LNRNKLFKCLSKAKQIIDSVVSLVGGAGAGFLGGVIGGSFADPLGMVFGSIFADFYFILIHMK